jgi:hypothetical protein
MNKKYFFELTHTIDVFKLRLGKHNLEKKEYEYLLKVAHSTMHFKSIEFILTELRDETEKKHFLSKVDKHEDHHILNSTLRSLIKDFDKRFLTELKKYEKELLKLLEN